MKYLRIASDLHLEWRKDTSTHAGILPEDSRDIDSGLVLAGDIGNGKPLLNFLEMMSKRFERVFYIPGNHEYYGSQGIKEWERWFKEKISTKILNNVAHAVGQTLTVPLYHEQKYLLHMDTMWTDCNHGNPIDCLAVEGGLNDFRAIPNFKVADMLKIHEAAKENIKNALIRDNIAKCKSIVVTHHMPSHSLIAEKYKAYSTINSGFAANCDDLMVEDWAPDLWIFGHTHDQIRQRVGKTLCVSNPLGYPNENSGYNFVRHCFIELESGSLQMDTRAK